MYSNCYCYTGGSKMLVYCTVYAVSGCFSVCWVLFYLCLPCRSLPSLFYLCCCCFFFFFFFFPGKMIIVKKKKAGTRRRLLEEETEGNEPQKRKKSISYVHNIQILCTFIFYSCIFSLCGPINEILIFFPH